MDFEDIAPKSGGGTCDAKAKQVISLGDDRSSLRGQIGFFLVCKQFSDIGAVLFCSIAAIIQNWVDNGVSSLWREGVKGIKKAY